MKEPDQIRLIAKPSDARYGTLSSASSGSHADPHDVAPTRLRPVGLLAFCRPLDHLLLAAGVAASVVHGAGFPLLSILLGGMTTVFLRAQNSAFVVGGAANASADPALPTITQDEFNEQVLTFTIYYTILGVAMFVTSYIQIACFEVLAERVVHSLRQNYLKSVLRQEIAWFDTAQTGNLTARLNDDLERVREGIGDKASMFVQMFAAFLTGFLVGFIYNWQMALVMCAFTPLLALTNSWMGKFTATRVQMEQEKYAVAGAIAEEAFGAMRTVLAFNGQYRELQRYERALEDGRRTGLVKYMYMALGFSATFLIMYTSYAVAFYFGALLVTWEPDFDRGTVFTVFFAVMTGSTSLGAALPNLTSMAVARGAARYVLGVINHVPYIDPYSRRGSVIRRPKGAVELAGVHFFYPLRPDVKVLKGVSFKAEPGQKVALVGASGCGKSTIVNLLMRFYDPVQGTVTLDGYDLRELNVARLRDCIGVVSQEPVLFDGTLEENIMLGNENATRQDVINCCKQANAYDFVQKLPDGLYTRVGERGVQLSGGQKQRIAIARALIRNPRILLLDEATSALDTESESIVQRALEKAQEGRTTIIVAHRLSTIRNADKILVFKEGNVVEQGTHAELIEAKGIFYEMVQAQQINQDADNKKLTAIREHSDEAEGHSSKASSVVKAPLSRRPSQQRKTSQPTKKKLSSYASSTVSKSSTATIWEMRKECEEHQLQPTSLRKILAMNRDKWGWLALGLLGCTISGLVMPFFALVYSQVFAVFSEPADRMLADALFWSLMFVLIGVVNGLGFFTSANALGQCGEALTKKLRLEAFRNLMRQDIGFYDDKRHNTGKLATRFSTDAPNVRYVFTRLPVVISSVVTLLGAIVIGFVYGWKLALILLTIVPLILASGYFELKMKFGKQMRDTALLEEAGKVASEAVENIRTVHGLNKQLIFQCKYTMHLIEPFYTNIRQAHVYAGVFAFSQSIMFFMYAIAFYLGSVFVNDRSMEPISVYRVFFAIAFCGQSVGQISSFIPDVVKARLAASLLFHLIEYPTSIDSLDEGGLRQKIKGNVELQRVHFSYPTRPGNKVLNSLSIRVEEGKTLALVGYSGCGKSTIMQLVERFYQPNRGSITIDDTPVRDLNIHNLREQVSIVSQEPTLFDCSILDNVTYGLRAAVPLERVRRACELANIHQFVQTLPERYDTRVGERGTQLSGGQKQRIAIARAMVRDPAVLLLDEATSALDTESEKVVQDALEKARKGRTCIVIAHRLSTVQNADQIAVVNEGRIVELGTHLELLNRPDGIYRQLCESQILKDDDGTE